MMIKYDTQLEEIQDKELVSGLGSKVSPDNCTQQVTKYLEDNPKRCFDTYSPDAVNWYGEQQQKKRIVIFEIVQILRTTKLQQCIGCFHLDEKYCAVGQ